MTTTTLARPLLESGVPLPAKVNPGPDYHGQDWSYRVYGIEHLPFNALPAWRDGGPATVARDGWSKSTSSRCRALSSPSVIAGDDGMTTLNLRRLDPANPNGPGIPHELNGTRYALQSDADRAAYEAGATGFMVYTREAARWGLPE